MITVYKKGSWVAACKGRFRTGKVKAIQNREAGDEALRQMGNKSAQASGWSNSDAKRFFQVSEGWGGRHAT